MSVSYLSQPYKPNPYVAPVSLDLLANVLAQKQGKFDANADKIQNNINTIASLDVIRGMDKDYINTKINNLVTNINSIGGQDLSDPNVANQIDGLATSVYSDEAVINAVSSTKRIRSLQASYDKMKTDPKLSKFWSDANYVNDMEAVNSYVGSKEQKATYQGNSTATPFFDYDKEYRDIFSKMAVNEYTYNQKTGYYLDKVANKEVAPETVMQAARERMSSNARAQMERDANYLYKYKANYGKSDLVAKAINDEANDLARTEHEYGVLVGQSLIEQDHGKKVQILTELEKQKELLNNKRVNLKNSIQNNSALYDSNPRELMYKVFSNDYIKGLARTYSFKKENTVRTADPVEKMFFEANERRINTNATLKAAKELQELKGTQSLTQKQLELAAEGKGRFDSNGKFILITPGQPLGPNGLGDVASAVPAKDIEEAINLANNRINSIEDESASALRTFAERLYADAGIPFNVEKLDVNGDRKFTMDDLSDWTKINNNLFVQRKDDKGSNLPAIISDEKEINIVRQLSLLWDAHSKGVQGNIKTFPQGTQELLEQLRFNQLHRDKLKDDILSYAASGKNNFIVKNYKDRIFPTDSKFQNSEYVSTLKSYLSKKADIPTMDFDLESITKKDDNSYLVAIKYKNGKDDATTNVIEVGPSVAAYLGQPEDRSQILNDVVTYSKPITGLTVQNSKDPNFVGNIKVYTTSSNLNGQKYKFAYYMNGTYVPINASKFNPSLSDEYESAAQAWNTAKEFIKNNPLSKQKFEEILQKNN